MSDSNACAGLALICLFHTAAFAALAPSDDASSIQPAHAELLIRSYKRCIDNGPDGRRSANEARLFAASLPFDLDAFGALTAADIDSAPRELVSGVSYVRCEWFGPPVTAGARGTR